jgi:hypothetical protein
MSTPPTSAPRLVGLLRAGRTAVPRVLRLIVPLSLVPLCIAANLLVTAPWLRSFPVSVAGAPMYAAAVLSVLIPLVTTRLRRRLWLSVLIDLVAFAIYTLLVVLRDPVGFGALLHGLYRGPAEVLTFALPLVNPRSLMVAPVALTWLAGALTGECIARRWHTLLPYIGLLVCFGLAYAGTQRAAGSDIASARTRETLLAAGLLVALLLLRVAESWLRQDETAETTQPDGRLPLRSLIVGTATALVVAIVASLVVQADAFPKRSRAPQRVPSVNESNPLTPLSFVAGIRPRTRTKHPAPVFTVSVDRPAPGYFAIANLDTYNGSGWSFQRTFRPSGGVLPADTDTDLRTNDVVTQQYRIASGPLTTRVPTPWMPFLYRAQKVTGTAVNIDPASGMVVPAGRLSGGEAYTVRSAISSRTFNQLKAKTATADLATPPVDTQLPPSVRIPLGQLVTVLSGETHTSSLPALAFLQALQRDLQQNYALSQAAQGSSTGVVPSASPSTSTSPANGRSTSATGAGRSNAPAKDLAGGTGFADVLASIVGASRSGTPEQFATLVALIARSLDVPARVVTGFRIAPARGSTLISPGAHVVTAADAWTWVEVPVVGSGWVVLDPSPQRLSANNTPTQSAAPPPPATSVSATPNPLITPSRGGNGITKRSPTSRANNTGISLLVGLLIVAMLLIVVLVVLLLARKPMRAARRKRAPDPRRRLIGAWQESIDVLTEAGLPELRALTSSEIARLAGERFGATPQEQAASLGSAANAVTYSSATVVEPADADAAWEHVRVLRKAVREQLGPRDRVVATLRYHRTRAGDVPRSPSSWAAAAVDVLATPTRNTRQRRNYRGRRRAH